MHSRELLAGAGAGALLVFMLDPARGARRRALVRDKLVWATRKTRDGADATARDLRNRTAGSIAAIRGRRHGRTVDDVKVLERVRARLGRVCSHPHAIDVLVQNGAVTLRGPILDVEVQDVVNAVSAVKGVTSVVNELQPHADASNVPALQGRGRRPGSRLDIFQRNWAPATQALVGAGALAASLAATVALRR
jgi:hypothetical protein